jgi:hypothetical protein
MNKESTTSTSELERRPAVSTVVDECHQDPTTGGDHTPRTTDSKKQLLNKLRQKMRERLTELLQVRSAGNPRDPPKAALTNAATTIEALLFRSVNGREDGERFYLELLHNQDAIQSTLKELGTGILLQKLQEKQAKLGFRSKMVLKKGMGTTIRTQTKSDLEGYDIILNKASHHFMSTTRKDEGRTSSISSTTTGTHSRG